MPGRLSAVTDRSLRWQASSLPRPSTTATKRGSEQEAGGPRRRSGLPGRAGERALAAAGDAVIALLAFWAAALVAGSRRWLMQPSPRAWSTYLGLGIGATIALEWLATAVFERWRYGSAMPTLPWVGTGLVPLAQWILLPPLVVFLARGQLRGRAVRP